MLNTQRTISARPFSLQSLTSLWSLAVHSPAWLSAICDWLFGHLGRGQDIDNMPSIRPICPITPILPLSSLASFSSFSSFPSPRRLGICDRVTEIPIPDRDWQFLGGCRGSSYFNFWGNYTRGGWTKAVQGENKFRVKEGSIPIRLHLATAKVAHSSHWCSHSHDKFCPMSSSGRVRSSEKGGPQPTSRGCRSLGIP